MSKVKVSPAGKFSINISSIAPDKSISHRSVMFSMLANDDDAIGASNISGVVLGNTTLIDMEYIGGDMWVLISNASAFGCTSEGECLLTATATDSAQNQNSTNYNLTIDYNAPVISSFTSNATNNISASDVILNFTVSITDGISNLTVTINDTIVSSCGDNLWCLLSNASDLGCISEVVCYMTANVVDEANNTANKTYELIINDETPFFNITGLSKVFDNSPEFNLTTSEECNCTYRTDYNPAAYTLMDATNGFNHTQVMPDQNMSYVLVGGQYSYVQHKSYINGNHTLYLNCTDTAGASNTTSLNFTIYFPLRDKVFYRDTDRLMINVTYQKPGLQVSVNLSVIDSGYNTTHNETVTDKGDGNYTIEYNISAGNSRANGQYKVYVIANDSGVQTSNTSTYLHLHNTWEWSDVNDALTCRGGNPGYYFDENNYSFYLYNNIK